MFRKLTKKSGKDKEGEWTKHDDKVLQAIEAGDTEKLQAALSKKGTSPIKMDPDGRVPLHEAAKLGQGECLQVLLQTGVGVGVADTHGLTPLHYASMGGFVACTQLLLQARASIRSKDLADKTPLHYAVLGGHLKVTQMLLEAKADIDAKEEYNKTPLMYACQQGHLALCKELIDRGANVNAQEQLLKTSLMLACEHAHTDVIDLLIKRGARADLHDAQGFDAMYYAESSGQEEVKGHLESAPSVATWDVGGDDESVDEPQADAVDYIAKFDTNDRSESPLTITMQKQDVNKNMKEDVPTNGLSKDEIDEIKELEEENEVLNEELRQMQLDHKKAQDRITTMEQHIMQLTSGVKENSHNQEYETELEIVKSQLADEKSRNTEANEELETLRSRLDALEDLNSDNDVGDDADNDSWGDSDDGDLFDLPATGMSPRPTKTKAVRKRTTSQRSAGSENRIIATLRSEVEEMKRDNEDLKRRLEVGETHAVPMSEYDDLRQTSESRITNLEEEIADLKEELKQKAEIVSAEEYDKLKTSSKRESRIMQEQLAMLADEMANTTEKLAHVTDDNNRLKRQSLHRSQSPPQPSNKHYQEMLQDKTELEEAIQKYTITMTDQADEVQRLHKKCKQLALDKTELQNKIDQQVKVHESKMNESDKECNRLQNMVSKQSKAIASQNEKARKDKKTLVDLMKEKETLANELHRLKTDNTMNGDEGHISKAKYDEVMEENKLLQETISSQEGTLQGSQGDRDRLEFLTKENWRLQGALRRQEDTMSKKHAELKRYKKLAQTQGGKEDFAKHLEELDAENFKLQEELDKCKEDLHSKEADVKKLDQLQDENEQLREKAKNITTNSEREADTEREAAKEKFNVILKENLELKEDLKRLKGPKIENGVHEKDVNNKKEVDDLNGKLEETVRVYRAHLLNAVQGNWDTEVKKALLQIVKLRNNGHTVT